MTRICQLLTLTQTAAPTTVGDFGEGLGFRGLGSGVGICWFFGFGGAVKTNLFRDFPFLFFTSSLFACLSVYPSVPLDLIGLGSRRNKLRNKFVPEIFVSVSLRRVHASAGPSIRPFRPFDGPECLRA